MDARRVKELAAAREGVVLDDAAAERLSRTAAAIADTLGAVARESLFDTEPAHFDRALAAMATRRDD